MAKKDEKQQYDMVPRTQEDLAERLANGNESSRVLSTSDKGAELQRKAMEDGEGRDYRVEDNDTDAYVGALDPEYVTYANETEKPMLAESGPEAELEKQIAENRDSANQTGVAGKDEVDAVADAQDSKLSESSESGKTAPSGLSGQTNR